MAKGKRFVRLSGLTQRRRVVRGAASPRAAVDAAVRRAFGPEAKPEPEPAPPVAETTPATETPEAAPTAPSILHLTDRSRFSLGWGRCARARWLQFHSGPTGYGIRRKATAIPLATGLRVHKGIEAILKNLGQSRQGLRATIQTVVDAYMAHAASKGVADTDQDYQAHVIREQATLIEGLLWGFVRVVLPVVLERWEVVSIETEETWVMGCTCRLAEGIGTPEEHATRGCQGTVLMSRPDLILRDKASGELANVDLKTGSQIDSPEWLRQWENNVQNAVGTVGAEKRLGEELRGGFFIVGLNKGARKKTKLEGDVGWNYTGPKQQQTVLCYAWKRPANPPHWPETWTHSWEFVGEDGRNHTLKGKGYEKAPVWTANFPGKGEMTTVEYWVESLPEETLRGMFAISGPYPRPTHLTARLLAALNEEENRWRERLWRIWTALEPGGGRLDAPGVIETLDREAPQTWECYRYYNHCEFLPICLQQPGWEDPLGSGKYEVRTPHHALELEQGKARGVEFPDEEGQEEGE